jgi:hypothetical protein
MILLLSDINQSFRFCVYVNALNALTACRNVYDCSAPFKYDVQHSRCKRLNASGKMVNTMHQSKYDNAADLHISAAHAHTAAAAAHHRGDHEAAEELSSRAQDYSMAASERTLELAKQNHVPMRA